MNTTLHRTWLTVLGIGMVILWIAGLSAPPTSDWLAWLDLIAAVCAFVGVSGTRAQTDQGSRTGGTLAISAGIFALWLGGLVNHTVSWLTWWNAIFACAFLALGIAVSRGKRTTTSEQTLPFRRTA